MAAAARAVSSSSPPAAHRRQRGQQPAAHRVIVRADGGQRVHVAVGGAGGDGGQAGEGQEQGVDARRKQRASVARNRVPRQPGGVGGGVRVDFEECAGRGEQVLGVSACGRRR